MEDLIEIPLTRFIFIDHVIDYQMLYLAVSFWFANDNQLILAVALELQFLVLTVPFVLLL